MRPRMLPLRQRPTRGSCSIAHRLRVQGQLPSMRYQQLALTVVAVAPTDWMDLVHCHPQALLPAEATEMLHRQ